MTNVKLKLMFFLLNALLTADVVHSRPYSDTNTTDIVIKFSSNNTFNLPVDPNSDTLKVANENENDGHDDETPEQTNVSSNTNMEAIMNAEQDRDKMISVNRMRKPQPVPDIPKDGVDAIEKQINISSSLLEDIMDSETDREETITDILFKTQSELVELPKFEFLIAAKINETDFSNRSIENNVKDRNGSDILKKVDYVELVEVGKPMEADNKSAYIANITGHEVDDDLAPDTSEYYCVLIIDYDDIIDITSLLRSFLNLLFLFTRLVQIMVNNSIDPEASSRKITCKYSYFDHK